MAKVTSSLGTTQYYGNRTRHEGVGGTQGRKSDIRELVLAFSGADYLTARATIPAGSMITSKAMVEVTEAFVVGGTTPTINIGTLASPGTNYLAELSEAQAEAVGTYVLAPAGTLAVDTIIAADTVIGIGLDGTTPTLGAAGKAKLVIQYKSI